MDRSIIGNLRLVSGLILFLFVLGHFANHALGIISLRAMNDSLKYFIQPWRDPVGEFLLFSAVIVHTVLALHSLYIRRTLSFTWKDGAQLFSGFLIPILLVRHILGTRGLHEVFGVLEGYEFVLYALWVSSPLTGVINTIGLIVVWFHACLGWHMFFRLKPWYQKIKLPALCIAIVIPTLALAGYASASLRVSRLSGSDSWVARLFKRTSENAARYLEFIDSWQIAFYAAFFILLVILLAFRLAFNYNAKRKAGAVLNYSDFSLSQRAELPVSAGASVLDTLRSAQISHAAVCGGRGRCSTCRIRVEEGNEYLQSPSAQESTVLRRIGAPSNVRLACQVRPTKNLKVTALMKPEVSVREVLQPTRESGGEEQEVSILFADIRAFTKISETKLPYDTAFLLNRYFAAMGQAIEEAGGHLDKFIGDGVMAIFGVDESYERGCKRALRAASKMSEKLDILNETLGTELQEPLRIGIGIHSGTAIVGNMGYNQARGLTAIGDVVNTASRLEALTKEYQVQLIVSKATVEASGMSLDQADLEFVNIRGRQEPLPIYKMKSANLTVKPKVQS